MQKQVLDLTIFSGKELIILKMLLEGKAPKEIAHELNLTVTWIYHPINRIYLKAQCKTKNIHELKAKFI